METEKGVVALGKERGIHTLPTPQKERESEREKGRQLANSQMPPEEQPPESGPPAIFPQALGTGVAALVQMDIGAIFAYPGVTLPQLLDQTSQDLVLNTAQAALFGSVIYLGAMVGSFLVGLPMVRHGQRVTLLMALPLSLASWITLAIAPSVWMILTARVCQGVALSFMTSSSTTYVAEVAHSSVRGRLMTTIDLCRQLGSLLIYCLGITSLTWRQVALTAALMNTILPFVGFLLLPNSPRWLATRHRTEDARRALRFFRGPNYDIDDELQAITGQLQKSSGKQMNVMQQLRHLREPAILRYVLTMAFVMFFLHFNGSTIIMAYVVIIMNTAQVQMSSYLAAIAVAITKIAGTFCFSLFIDRVNRKSLFTAASLICAVALSILGSFFFDQSHGSHFQHLEWLPVLCLATYAFSAASPVIGLLRSELFPTSVRSTVVPILYTTFFIGAFLALQTYPYMVAALGSYGTFWVFAGCNLILGAIVYFTIPETRGKTLEQITEMQQKATRATH